MENHGELLMNTLNEVTNKAEVSYMIWHLHYLQFPFLTVICKATKELATQHVLGKLPYTQKSHTGLTFFSLGTHIGLFLFFRFLKSGCSQLCSTLFSTLGSKERETVLSVMLAFPLLKV